MARIRVILKSTGQTGSVDESQFDPTMFEKLSDTTALQSTLTGTRATDVKTGISKVLTPQTTTQPKIDTTSNLFGGYEITDDKLMQVLMDPNLKSTYKSNIKDAYDMQQKIKKEKAQEQTRAETLGDVYKKAQDLPTNSERTSVQDTLLFAESLQKTLEALDKAEKSSIYGFSGTGPIVNFMTKIATAAGSDTPQAELKDRLMDTIQIIRKNRTGVAFSDQEQKDLESLFGTLSTQEAPLRRKIEDLLYRSANEVSAKLSIPREDLDRLFKYTTPPTVEDVDQLKKNETTINDTENKSSITGEIVKELTSPSTILSTAGDISGEILGTVAAPFTFGAVNPVTASGALAGAGEYVGNIIEDINAGKEIDWDKAKNQAALATVVSAATPAVLKLGSKVVKPVLKIPGEIVEKYIGENLSKLGTDLLQSTAKLARERGINVFDEIGQRGFSMLKSETAEKAIKFNLGQAEKDLQKAVSNNTDSILNKSEIKTWIDEASNKLLDSSDKKALNNLWNDINKKFGESLDAKSALEAKRLIYEKVIGKNSPVAKVKNQIAFLVNDQLKDKVPEAAKLLREEETLIILKDVFSRLADKEYSKGALKSINLINPTTLFTSLLGDRSIRALGQAAQIAGKTEKNIVDIFGKGITNAVESTAGQTLSKFKQPLRSILTGNNQ